MNFLIIWRRFFVATLILPILSGGFVYAETPPNKIVAHQSHPFSKVEYTIFADQYWQRTAKILERSTASPLFAQVKSPGFLQQPFTVNASVSNQPNDESSPPLEQLEIEQIEWFLQSEPPPGLQKFALLLPTAAEGLPGNVASDFRRGCVQGVQASGRVEVDLYAGNGNVDTLIRNYEAAARSGAQAIIGGMLKSGARALTERYPKALLPTLLLQGGELLRQDNSELLQQSDGESYYVMTLDDSREAADLARQLHRREDSDKIFIVEQDNARGSRQRESFETTMNGFGISITLRMRMRDIEHDLRRLFERMKGAEPTPIFAAGTPKFAINVRNFLPPRHPVFSVSSVNNNGGGVDSVILDNLAFIEMPWFLGLSEQLEKYDSPSARALPFLRQRFFAFGVDACRAILQQPNWRDGWSLPGVSGHWILYNGIFSRLDNISVYRGGRLRPIN